MNTSVPVWRSVGKGKEEGAGGGIILVCSLKREGRREEGKESTRPTTLQLNVSMVSGPMQSSNPLGQRRNLLSSRSCSHTMKELWEIIVKQTELQKSLC